MQNIDIYIFEIHNENNSIFHMVQTLTMEISKFCIIQNIDVMIFGVQNEDICYDSYSAFNIESLIRVTFQISYDAKCRNFYI